MTDKFWLIMLLVVITFGSCSEKPVTEGDENTPVEKPAETLPDITGKNIKGIVSCDGVPVEGVVVSDGIEVTATDSEGRYWLDSEKKHGYVFISVPSGYECPRTGVVPMHYRHLSGSASATERVDFELIEAPDQTVHRMLVFGDMHLANRPNKDVVQFEDFTGEINDLVASTSVPVYAMTLGDMTWDTFWYTRNYYFEDYLEDINVIKDLGIYHTIGNHDHESGKAGAYPTGDWETSVKYKAALGPTYYSFNIGKVHYIVLDDIYCTNDGTGSTTYSDIIANDQIEWLKKDLSFVGKDMQIVVASHAQFHNKSGVASLDNYATLMNCFEGFGKIHVFTGHTHLIYNIEKENVFEHNAGAVCATWWWTYHHSKIHIAQDGAPGGYTIADINGTELQWLFKGTGRDENYQFRCYDGNSILINADRYCPNATSEQKTKFDGYASGWSTEKNDNSVYINVWNWDPEWNVEVTEEGKPLEVTKVSLRDPLHLIAYTAPSIGTPTFATSENHHFFKVTASDATSTLEVRVTDRFGRVFTEKMTRPRTFSINQYK